MKIRVKIIEPICTFSAIKKGDWIDLKSSKEIILKAPMITKNKEIKFSHETIRLGIAMELPKYFEANILPRSSTFSTYGAILTNSMGVIDHTYCGDKDEWKFQVLCFENGIINSGARIAQFRIRPSQFAPWWIKVKWLFTNKLTFVPVDSLKNESRGGFGSTGIK